MNKTKNRKPIVLSKKVDICQYSHLTFKQKCATELLLTVGDFFPNHRNKHFPINISVAEVEAVKNKMTKHLYFNLFSGDFAVVQDDRSTARVASKIIKSPDKGIRFANWQDSAADYIEIIERNEGYYEPIRY